MSVVPKTQQNKEIRPGTLHVARHPEPKTTEPEATPTARATWRFDEISMAAAWGNYTAVGGLGFRHSWVTLAIHRSGKTGASDNPFLNMPIAQLVEEKRRLEEAWRVGRAMVR